MTDIKSYEEAQAACRKHLEDMRRDGWQFRQDGDDYRLTKAGYADRVVRVVVTYAIREIQTLKRSELRGA